MLNLKKIDFYINNWLMIILMGNILFNYDKIRFIKFNLKQIYIYKIEIEINEFNIQDIKNKLISLNIKQIDDSIDNIMTTLNDIKQNETDEILSQVKYLWIFI